MILQARKLKIMDKAGIFKKGPGSSDPLVTVSLGSKISKTTVKSKDLNPVWNEVFVIAHSDPGSVLNVKVEDEDKLSGNDFIGGFSVPMAKIKNGEEMRGWRTLETLEGEVRRWHE